MKTAIALALIAALAAPALAQQRVATVRDSAFASDSARLYGPTGKFLGTARRNAFNDQRVDIYGPTGRATGIQVWDNSFSADRADVYDAPTGYEDAE